MKFTECGALLATDPLNLETGYERLADGVLHVACRTDMHGCTGEMFEWWFQSRPDTRQYIWWHPVDHISSDWAESEDGTHVGSIHLVEERFTGLAAEKLSIQFRPVGEFFDSSAYDEARAAGQVTGAICARVGISHAPPRDEQGRIVGGRLIHVGRDRSWGYALRSHFFLGQDLPALGKSPPEIEGFFPETFARALLQHCYNEFTYLAKFLPSLFIAENRQVRPIKDLPW